jgi:predicted ribosomally synthesized peptide with nif11-like leader
MSQANAQKFMDRLEKNKAMRAQVKKAGGNAVQVGKKHGYAFTNAELKKHLAKRWAGSKPKPYDETDLTCITGA